MEKMPSAFSPATGLKGDLPVCAVHLNTTNGAASSNYPGQEQPIPTSGTLDEIVTLHLFQMSSARKCSRQVSPPSGKS